MPQFWSIAGAVGPRKAVIVGDVNSTRGRTHAVADRVVVTSSLPPNWFVFVTQHGVANRMVLLAVTFVPIFLMFFLPVVAIQGALARCVRCRLGRVASRPALFPTTLWRGNAQRMCAPQGSLGRVSMSMPGSELFIRSDPWSSAYRLPSRKRMMRRWQEALPRSGLTGWRS